MTQLNSPFLTALQRRYVPIIVSGILLVAFGLIFASSASTGSNIAVAAGVIVLVALLFFGVYRALIYPTAEQVMLDGDMLRVTQHGKESAIPAQRITGIRCNPWISPEIVTLEMADDGSGRSSITFIPPARMPGAKEHPVLQPLRAVMQRG